MFEIAITTEGKSCVVTDNPKIADAIHEEDAHAAVWFTGAPSKETARALAAGLEKDFGRPATFTTGGKRDYCRFSACFRVGDYASDPLDDGSFRMIPSGDVVDLEERNRRLG